MEANKQPKNMSNCVGPQVVFQVGESIVWMHTLVNCDFKTVWQEYLLQEQQQDEELTRDLEDTSTLHEDFDFPRHRQKSRTKNASVKKIVKSLRAKKKSNRVDTIDDFEKHLDESVQNLKEIKEDEDELNNCDYEDEDEEEEKENNRFFENYKYTLSQY